MQNLSGERGGERQAAYNNMQKILLGEIADLFAGKPITRLTPGSISAVLLGVRNIGDHLTTTGELEHVKVDACEIERFGLNPGDLVASVRGSFRVALANPSHVGAIAGGNTAVIRLRENLPPHVVAAYLRHPAVTGRLTSAFVGSTVPGISLDALRQTPLRLPKREVLIQLSGLVESADRYHDAVSTAARARNALAAECVLRALGEEVDP